MSASFGGCAARRRMKNIRVRYSFLLGGSHVKQTMCQGRINTVTRVCPRPRAVLRRSEQHRRRGGSLLLRLQHRGGRGRGIEPHGVDVETGRAVERVPRPRGGVAETVREGSSVHGDGHGALERVEPSEPARAERGERGGAAGERVRGLVRREIGRGAVVEPAAAERRKEGRKERSVGVGDNERTNASGFFRSVGFDDDDARTHAGRRARTSRGSIGRSGNLCRSAGWTAPRAETRPRSCARSGSYRGSTRPARELGGEVVVSRRCGGVLPGQGKERDANRCGWRAADAPARARSTRFGSVR